MPTPLYLQSPYFEAGIFVAILIVAGTMILAFSGTGSATYRKRYQRVTNTTRVVTAGKNPTASLRRKTGDESLPLMRRLVDGLPSLSAIRARLDRAGKSISAERYVMISLLVLAFVTLFVKVLTGVGILIALFIGVIFGIGMPHFLLNHWGNKRLKRFVRLFPTALDLIVRGLRSGLPVGESIKLVSKEVEDPVASTFQSIADTMKLGVPLEKILTDTAKRLHCTEFDFFVTSIILQRETGGNLSEILNNLSEVLRKRFLMREKIKAMTSEARASMYIIGALPFFVATAVSFMSPGYLEPLWTDFRGNIALATAIGSLTTGITVMGKMSKFEI